MKRVTWAGSGASLNHCNDPVTASAHRLTSRVPPEAGHDESDEANFNGVKP